MPSQLLRRSIAGARHLARGAGIATRFARRSGMVSALSARGLMAIPRSLVTVGRGPQLALALQARNAPRRLALVDTSTGRRMNYEEVDREVNQLAWALGDLGVRAGDRVALMLPNCAEYVLAQQALMRVGCAAVQVGYRLKAGEIAHILENSNPSAVLVHADYWHEMTRARELAGGPDTARVLVHAGPPDVRERSPDMAGVLTYGEAIARHDGRRPPRWKDARHSATIVYTSGTTGKPKGASRNFHEVGIFAGLEVMAEVGMHRDDRHMVVCPLYHSAAPVFAAMALMTGASAFVFEHFDAETVLAVIERERLTCGLMVPTMLARLCDLPAAVRERYDTSSLRWIMSAAAPLSTDTAVRFQEYFGPILYNFYGSTETGMVTLAEPPDHAAHPGTIGRALYGNEIRLLDDHGNEVAPGEVGELYVRNSMLMTGYHGDRQATDEAQRSGFVSVGDMARVDQDGFYYMESRKRDMIISGGVNIYPREIEDFLHVQPGIRDVAVVGVPDREWGETVHAVVVLEPGSELDEAAIIQLCRDGLAGYKRPRRVHFVDELPRNLTGKVLKRQLRSQLQEMS